MNRQILVLAALALFGGCASRVFAQALTADSETDLFIADVVDGGTASDRWTTQFRFVNSGAFIGGSANGTIYFFADDGSPLVVTVGSITSSNFSISVPASGSARFETSGISATLRQGFVRMLFDSPVSVTAEFRNWKNGIVANGASVNALTPADSFWYFADAYTGIAVGNSNDFAVNCTGTFLDPQGITLKSTGTITMGAFTHRTFNPGSLLALPPTTIGSFQWGCLDGAGNPTGTVSLGIAGTASGITSSLPNSPVAFPIHHWEDIAKAFKYTVKAIQTTPDLAQYAALSKNLAGPPVLLGSVKVGSRSHHRLSAS